eukprot:scaffold154936_cov30-Tisochrysis_lutea.AAC.6
MKRSPPRYTASLPVAEPRARGGAIAPGGATCKGFMMRGRSSEKACSRIGRMTNGQSVPPIVVRPIAASGPPRRCGRRRL